MKRYNINMFGRKTITEPTPVMMPSTSRLRSGPGFMAPPTKSPSQVKRLSIQSIGYCPIAKVQ